MTIFSHSVDYVKVTVDKMLHTCIAEGFQTNTDYTTLCGFQSQSLLNMNSSNLYTSSVTVIFLND